MQSIDNLPPTPDASFAPKSAQPWNDPAPNPSTREQFDDVMGRTLARSSSSSTADSDSSDEVPRTRYRPQHDRRTNDTSLSQLVCGESPGAPPHSSRADSASGLRHGSGTHGRADRLADASQASGRASTTSNDSREAGSDQGAPGTGRSQSSSADSGDPATAGAEEASGTAREQTAAAGRLLLLVPGADGKAAPDLSGSEAAGKVIDPGKLAAPAPGSPAGPETTGISSAQQQTAMQKPEQTSAFSASAEQKLPVPPAGVTGEELPGKATRTLNSLSGQQKSDPALSTDSAAFNVSSPTETASSSAASTAWPLDTPLRSLERAHDLMALHAFRLRDSGADSLQVVIKPGPDLQLSLSLHMRDGAVDIQATLNRGDFDHLNRHWSELQQQLEARGVRVAALISGESGAGGDQNLQQQPDRRSLEGDAVSSGALADIPLLGGLKPATTIKTMQTPRGWESWA